MVGQVPLEESNIALINSDLAKEVRAKAAEFEPEWSGAGEKEGIEIWRSENLGIKRWPADDTGKFFDGDSYIVLNTYKREDKILYNVHFWLGANTSQDEAGVAAYKTVELDDRLGQLPVQFREVMGYESEAFLKLFPPAPIIMNGGADSGFNHVEPTEYKPRLLHIKGKRNKLRVMEKPMSRSSLNQGDSFVLDAGLKLFQWNGPSAGIFEKRQANEIVVSIKTDRKGLPTSQILDGDEECDEFWSLLGGMGDIRTADEGGSDELVESGERKMMKLSDSTGDLVMEEVPFSKASLSSDDVFLVDDRKVALYVWVGNGASTAEKGKAFQYANMYLEQSSMAIQTPVCRVSEGNTSEAFETCFA